MTVPSSDPHHRIQGRDIGGPHLLQIQEIALRSDPIVQRFRIRDNALVPVTHDHSYVPGSVGQLD